MKRSLTVFLVLFVSLFFVVAIDAGRAVEEDDRFPFDSLPEELQDRIWEETGWNLDSNVKNLLVRRLCRKLSEEQGGPDSGKAKARIIADNLTSGEWDSLANWRRSLLVRNAETKLIKRSTAESMFGLPREIQGKIRDNFMLSYRTMFHNKEKFEKILPESSSNFSQRIFWRTEGRFSGILFEDGEFYFYLLKAGGDGLLKNGSTIEKIPVERDKIYEFITLSILSIQDIKLHNKGYLIIHLNDGRSFLVLERNGKKWLSVSFKRIDFDNKGRLFFADSYTFCSSCDHYCYETCNEITMMYFVDDEIEPDLKKFAHDGEVFDFVLDEGGERERLISLTTEERMAFTWKLVPIEKVKLSRIYVWDVERGNRLITFFSPENSIVENFLLEGKYLFLFCKNNKTCMMDIETGRCRCKFEGHENTVLGGILDESKRFLFTFSFRDIRMWDVKSGRSLKVFRLVKSDIVHKIWLDPLDCLNCVTHFNNLKWDIKNEDYEIFPFCDKEWNFAYFSGDFSLYFSKSLKDMIWNS